MVMAISLRTLPNETYAFIIHIISIVTIANVFIDYGTTNVTARYLLKFRKKTSQLIIVTLIQRFLVFLCLSLVIIALYFILNINYLWVILLSLFAVFNPFFLISFFGYEKIYSIFNSVNKIAYVFLIFLLLPISETANTFLILYTISFITPLAAFIIIYRAHVKDFRLVKPMFFLLKKRSFVFFKSKVFVALNRNIPIQFLFFLKENDLVILINVILRLADAMTSLFNSTALYFVNLVVVNRIRIMQKSILLSFSLVLACCYLVAISNFSIANIIFNNIFFNFYNIYVFLLLLIIINPLNSIIINVFFTIDERYDLILRNYLLAFVTVILVIFSAYIFNNSSFVPFSFLIAEFLFLSLSIRRLR